MKQLQAICVFVLCATATAQATEQQMVVNEILISANTDPGAQLLELRDIGDETFDNPTYSVDVFDTEAAKLGRIDVPGLMGGNGPRFYVLSTAKADTALSITGNGPLTTPLPVDGQACFIGTNERLIHCVAWGCVTTKVTPATPLGASPPNGESLQRTPTGAALTIAAPTPAADNMDGIMDDPCPTGPMGDVDPGDGDAGGGCCQTSHSGRFAHVGQLATLGMIVLIGLFGRRRRV